MIDKGRDFYANFFFANNIFCHINENHCVQGCCSHTLWQYSSNLQRKSNFENGSQIKGRDGKTNYAQGLFFCRILKAGWLPAGKLIKRKVASSQVRNANPRCWHVRGWVPLKCNCVSYLASEDRPKINKNKS